MASITVEDGVRRVEIHGLHTVRALKNRLAIPLANVERIERDPRLTLPGLYAAGAFLVDGDRSSGTCATRRRRPSSTCATSAPPG